MLPENDPEKLNLYPAWGEFIKTLSNFDLPELKYTLVNPRRAPLEIWDSAIIDKYPFFENPMLGDRAENGRLLAMAQSVNVIISMFPHNRFFQPDQSVAHDKVVEDIIRLSQWNIDNSSRDPDSLYSSMANINRFLLDLFVQLPRWEEARELINPKFEALYRRINAQMEENDLVMGDKVLLNGRQLPQNGTGRVVILKGSDFGEGVFVTGNGKKHIVLADGKLELNVLVEVFRTRKETLNASLMALDIESIGDGSKRLMEWLSQDEKTIEYCSVWESKCEEMVQTRVRKLGSSVMRVCEKFGMEASNRENAAILLERYILDRLLP